jgi:hypothetical protein
MFVEISESACREANHENWKECTQRWIAQGCSLPDSWQWHELEFLAKAPHIVQRDIDKMILFSKAKIGKNYTSEYEFAKQEDME